MLDRQQVALAHCLIIEIEEIKRALGHIRANNRTAFFVIFQKGAGGHAGVLDAPAIRCLKLAEQVTFLETAIAAREAKLTEMGVQL